MLIRDMNPLLRQTDCYTVVAFGRSQTPEKYFLKLKINFMKRFEVVYRMHTTIEAESFAEARKKFAEQYPIPAEPMIFADLDSGDEKEVIGFCEDSEFAIFEDDDYSSDFEGVMWLNNASATPNPGQGNAV